MMGTVVNWGGITKLNVPPNTVLHNAIEKDLDAAVVVGFNKEGEFFFASSVADGGTTLWLLALAQKKLLEIGYNG